MLNCCELLRTKLDNRRRGECRIRFVVTFSNHMNFQLARSEKRDFLNEPTGISMVGKNCLPCLYWTVAPMLNRRCAKLTAMEHSASKGLAVKGLM